MTALRNAGFTILIAAVFVPLAVFCSGCPEEGGGIECGPPITSAGEDQPDCTVGRMVILRGSVRLPPEDEQVCLTEKDTLTYKWEKVSGPDMEHISVIIQFLLNVVLKSNYLALAFEFRIGVNIFV